MGMLESRGQVSQVVTGLADVCTGTGAQFLICLVVGPCWTFCGGWYPEEWK